MERESEGSEVCKFTECCMAESEVLTVVFQSIKGLWDVAPQAASFQCVKGS